MARMKLQPRVKVTEADRIKAVGYCRVSTQEQVEHGVSLAAQEEAVRAYCVANGMVLERVFVERGISGGTDLESRPMGKEMIAYVREHGVSHVVAKSVDRMFRDSADANMAEKAFDKRGVALHLIREKIDTSTEMGKTFFALAAVFAQLERRHIKERVRTGMAYKKANGRAWGHTPAGYSREDVELGVDHLGEPVIDRRVTVDEEQAAIVREIVEMRYCQAKSFREIANNLTERGVPTAQTRKAGPPKWWPMTVRIIIEKNPIALEWTRHLQEIDAQEAALAA